MPFINMNHDLYLISFMPFIIFITVSLVNTKTDISVKKTLRLI